MLAVPARATTARLHHASRVSVVCDQAGSAWDLDLHPIRVDAPIQVLDDAAENASEVHVVLSFSQPVDDAYDAWRRDHPVSARVLRVQPPGGPSRVSVPREEVSDWAEAIYARMLRLRPPGRVPARLFIAAPNALAMALGRSMNGWGRLMVMDRIQEWDAYLQTFDMNL